ncbi:MAG: UDP-N-acetylmuramoyl-L-alanine--D-glutamate ligase [Candidatus Aquicultor sp.]|nr:UDP-N-acetylmuramoyl-L-alanine--D-glutamate ligase [Candidatus Aquicultor sp.]
MDLSNKRVLVIGLGRSGKAAALKLKGLGASVLASDVSTADEMSALAQELRAGGIDVELGAQDDSLLTGVDLVVVSPGVPSRVPLLLAARNLGLPVWSEIELAYRLTDKPIIAITGTNGKTTTTTLIGEVFDAAGHSAAVGGNIGTPLVSIADDSGVETLIVEVSSFQLDTIVDFRPKIAVLLNITEDHLDWHPDFADYARAKSRIFLNQTADDIAVLNLDDPQVKALVPGIIARVIGTSKDELKSGVCVSGGRMVIRLDKEIDLCGVGELKVRGSHNIDNVMAVAAACYAAGIEAQVIANTVTGFSGLQHRVEFVETINGVSYYNDSKATNVDATVKALTAFTEPLVLLAGGRNKGNSFVPLARSLGPGVKAVVGFGEAGRDILQVMPGDIRQEYEATVEDAVVRAAALSQPGDVVLLSPACASFDAFNGYTQRGDAFKKAVMGLGVSDGESKN